jgi:tyrosyl-tRNA synthetase
LPKEEIDALIEAHREAPHQRQLQKRLGQEITTLVHGTNEYEAAISATEVLFGQGTTEQLAAMNEQLFLQVFDGVPQFQVSAEKLNEGVNILELLAVESTVFPSKGEARKLVQQQAISINKAKFTDVNGAIGTSELINGKYLLVQKGKKQYYLIIAS